MCDELLETDLEMPGRDTDLALTSGLRRKRPDGWGIHWGRRQIRILEFTRPNDYSLGWHAATDAYKLEKYRPLRDRIAGLLPDSWTVSIVTFTLGIRGSYNESKWSTNLIAFDLSEKEIRVLMESLVTQCLSELNELFSVRSAALKVGT